MRASSRLLAAVKSADKYLTPGAPTGLTGIVAHPSPRTALVFAYASTLEKLKAFPETSVYRRSTEALTRRRLDIVEAYVPPGYDEWCERSAAHVQKNKDVYEKFGFGDVVTADGRRFVRIKEARQAEVGLGYYIQQDFLKKSEEGEGVNTESEFEQSVVNNGEGASGEGGDVWLGDVDEGETPEDPDIWAKMKLEPEPQLTSQQIGEIEDKIGGGLIEEVILVAKGELDLASTMLENKVWEDLEEAPASGQWEYHGRDKHQKPA